MLFPVLIATVSEVVGYAPRVQYILGFLFFIGFAFFAEYLLRKNLNMPYVGLGLSLLLASTLLKIELWGAMSIPLQLLLYVSIFALILRWKSFNFLQLLGLGAVCGLAVLNRFDAILLAPLLFMAHVVIFRKPLCGFAILLGALGAVMPWIIYSLSVFGVVFVTDNAWVVKSIDPRAFVTDWWPEPRPDLSDDFGAWLHKIAVNTVRFGGSILNLTIIWIVFIFFLSSIALLLILKYARAGNMNSKDESRCFLRTSFSFFWLMLSILLPQILSGYFQYRYYSALVFSAFLVCFSLIARSLASNPQRELVSSVFFLLCAVATAASLNRHWDISADKAASRWRDFDNPPMLQQLQNCMEENTSLRLLVIGDYNYTYTLAARLGAQGGFSTLMEPGNMARGDMDFISARKFITQWNIASVLVTDNARLHWAISTFDLVKVPDCRLHLYRTSLK